MDIFYKYAKMLDELNGVPTAQIIADIVVDHSELREKTKDRYGRYQQEGESTPILTRNFEGVAEKKINNKLANDYFGEIIDTKVGYMFGLPISYVYDKKRSNYQTVIDQVQRFNKVNGIDDLNAEFGKFAAMCGYDAGLLYIDRDAQERVMRIDPWDSVILSKTAITEPDYGLNYYTTWDGKARAEFYGPTNKIVFEGEEFTADKLQEVEGENKPHMFKYCPMFGIPNNAELQGDGDKVLTLIDAYDRSLSDMNSEIEQFRLAYLLYIGYEPDDGDLETMVKTGALYIPDAANGERIEWLTKDLDPSYIDSHLDRVEANITRFAKHVNFTDAAFGSNITGPAMRYKLFALETKSKYFERKHDAAMNYMYKVVGSAWQTKGIDFDYTLLERKYTRNIPVNIVDEANAATTLGGITSKRTALSTISVIGDVDEELEQIEREKEDGIDLDNEILKRQQQRTDPVDEE